MKWKWKTQQFEIHEAFQKEEKRRSEQGKVSSTPLTINREIFNPLFLININYFSSGSNKMILAIAQFQQNKPLSILYCKILHQNIGHGIKVFVPVQHSSNKISFFIVPLLVIPKCNYITLSLQYS